MIYMMSQRLYREKLKEYIVLNRLALSLFIIFFTLSIMTGCSGGGGSDSSLSVSPIDEEIRTVLNRLSTSFNATDTTQVMSVFDSSIKYYKFSSSTPWTIIYFEDLSKEVDNFFSKATSINMKFNDIAILSGTEDAASARALLTCDYIDQNGNPQSFSEEVELLLEKVGVWGIKEFYKYDKNLGATGSNFPPSL